MKYVYDDGGRAAAGFRGNAGDCVTRAIAIATGKPYLDVYNALGALLKAEAARTARRAKKAGRKPKTTARNGVAKSVIAKYLASIGWQWTPTMRIGSGCTVHLDAKELPKGRVVVSVSRHLVAVIDGTIRDTYDCSRDGSRCVYGYWQEGGAK